MKSEIPDTSNFATKDELSGKLDSKTYNEEKAGFATKQELQGYVTTETAEQTYAKKGDIPEAYTLPTATTETLGGVKVGAGLTIGEDGLLSATGGGTADSVEWNNVQNKPDFKTVATTGSYNDLTDKPSIPSKTSELTNDSGFLTTVPEEYVTETELEGKADKTAIADMLTKKEASTTYQPIGDYATTEALAQGLKGKADTTAIPTKLSQLTNDSNYLTDAPSDGKQYGRKNNEWSVIEAGGTQYLDLSMFSAESGTLSEEDYQKVVKAYEDKTITGINFMNKPIIIPIKLALSEGNYFINVYMFNNSDGYFNISSVSVLVNSDKSFTSIINDLPFILYGSGTKALTDNGQYAEFAKPTKVESGGSGTVTKELQPNVLYKFGECTNLTITLAASDNSADEYMFTFDSGSTPTSISLPDTVIKDEDDAIEANKHYEVSIRDNYLSLKYWNKA